MPGFNPNEEHAAIFENKVTALRDDLNIGESDHNLGLSKPYVLMKYQNPFTDQWQMKVFWVTNQTPEHPFVYPQQAAQEIQPPGANYHFEDQILNGKMSFDYRLRQGVVQKSNALELMRSVGLDVTG